MEYDWDEAKNRENIRREVPSVMSDDGITRVRLDPANPPKADWSRFEAMSEEERHAAALADAQPATEAQLASGRRRMDVRAIREGLGLSLEVFAERFGLPGALVREWEAGTRHPDRAAQMLLRVIASAPDTVARAAAE